MAIEIPRSLVEFMLLGPLDDRRQLQDSPILGDVWVEFAKNPGESIELLIIPYKEYAAGEVAKTLSQNGKIGDADIAYLQGIVAAKMPLKDVLSFVVPMSRWWQEKRMAATIENYLKNPGKMEKDIEVILLAAGKWKQKHHMAPMQDLDTRTRYIALAGLIYWAQFQKKSPARTGRNPEEQIRSILQKGIAREISAVLRDLLPESQEIRQKGLIWTVSLNRRATPALTKSVPAVKADAARTLFTVDCSEIVWAVIDSGIDATHPAFKDKRGKTRIEKSFDFTLIRSIVSLDNLGLDKRSQKKRREHAKELLGRRLKTRPSQKIVEENLEKLALGARDGHSVNWELVESLVEIDPGCPPPSNHGTHVAGILAASMHSKPAGEDETGINNYDWAHGMCPDIRVYDFRVLAPTLAETEFAIIAALQYIRYVNERNSFITIHGANLSLSIPHDVRNYACGRTPICNECERLVNSGVVVVAAAGNRGYQNFETNDGLYESYAAFSVTDPGNADGVITVGATHRFWPHTYGVSFFSSRGPTGDGRVKPDLVAPGERIRAPIPGNQWGELDGTSMATPHVSGGAAMLMARYSELIGQPRRIKEILCKSATDLGRERSFQGHGMLDVLRAFQSI
jgi:serine protease AprX